MFSLFEFLNEVDIPQQRRGDFRWLLRNLAIRNSKHPDIDRALAALKQLVKGT